MNMPGAQPNGLHPSQKPIGFRLNLTVEPGVDTSIATVVASSLVGSGELPQLSPLLGARRPARRCRGPGRNPGCRGLRPNRSDTFTASRR